MIQGNLSAVEFSPSKNVCLHLPGLSPFLPWEEPGFEQWYGWVAGGTVGSPVPSRPALSLATPHIPPWHWWSPQRRPVRPPLQLAQTGTTGMN